MKYILYFQFENIQNFLTGKNNHIASISDKNDNFIMLNSQDNQELQIFIYSSIDNQFIKYQNLQFESKINHLDVFHMTGNFNI